MTPPSFFGPSSASSPSLPRGGTPPLSRNSSSSSYPKRSSVVPFTRPGQRTSTDDGVGSFSESGSLSQPGTPYRPRRQSSGQGLPRSLEEYSFSQSPGRRRSDADSRSRRERSHPPAAREEGFHVHAPNRRAATPPGASLASEGSPQGHGLLSRHFSGTLASTGSPTPSETVLKVRHLQK